MQKKKHSHSRRLGHVALQIWPVCVQHQRARRFLGAPADQPLCVRLKTSGDKGHQSHKSSVSYTQHRLTSNHKGDSPASSLLTKASNKFKIREEAGAHSKCWLFKSVMLCNITPVQQAKFISGKNKKKTVKHRTRQGTQE